MPRFSTPSGLRAALLACLVGFSFTAPAAAQSQTNLVTPTLWAWRNGSSVSAINGLISGGYRMVDIEPLPFSSTFFAGGTFVRNTGDYAKGWWWYYGQTSAQVTSRMSQHNARLIDVEPYDTPSGIRYAIVLIPNSGQDFASGHGWRTNMTFSGLSSWISANPTRRIVDVQPYFSGGSQRYAFTYVTNSGNLASGWWIYLNVTPGQLGTAVSQNNARLTDLEHHDGTGRVSGIMVPNDGNAWFWFYGTSSTELARLTDQHSGRMIDFERYIDSGGSTRYSAVVRRNDNDLAVDANLAMRNRLPLSASSGLLLREIGSGAGTLAGTLETRTFEPASLIKTVHHFVACERVALGFDSFASAVTEATGLNGSCPTGTNVVTRTLTDVLRSMMEASSNTATEAIRARYGTAFIEARAGAFGATGVDLNHTVGCLCGMPRNEIRLDDLSDLHDAAADGVLGSATDEFYDYMVNNSNFGMGSFNTTTILNQELSGSTLTSEEQNTFRSRLQFAFKGGSYTCISGSNREEHRSRGGYMSLPFRSGCQINDREYFLGAWVNDAQTATSANEATGAGIVTLYRERLRAAIDSWEAASCTHFSSFCAAVPNSTGAAGLCTADGSPFILTNSLTIRASFLPPNVFGLLIYSGSTGFTPGLGGGIGNLCLGSPLVRFNASIQSSGSAGRFGHPLNLNALPRPVLGTRPVVSGETLYFQWWHRDLTSAGQATSNLTRGLRATFI